MARLRFVHAADLHLDSPFQGIRNEAPAPVANTLYRATFDTYKNIVDLCLRERVDALLVAGDVYDSADRSLRAQLEFVEGLARLDAAGVRSFICHGNHDPLDGWEARLDLPPGCARFGPEVIGHPVFPSDPERATVYGISYPRREMRKNLSPLFDGIVSGSGFNIGLLHANVGGNPNHDSYSPARSLTWKSPLSTTGRWATSIPGRSCGRTGLPSSTPATHRAAIPPTPAPAASTWWRWTTPARRGWSSTPWTWCGGRRFPWILPGWKLSRR